MFKIPDGVRAAIKPALYGVAIGAVGWWVILAFPLGWMSPGAANQRAEEAVASALVPVCADQFVKVEGALAALREEKTDRDYDDVVIKFVKKVGDRTLSTSDRLFAMNCGREVMRRDKATAK